MYDDFLCHDDEDLCREFHQASWADRVALLDNIKDHRARELGQRLIFAERPELLPEETRARLRRWLQVRALGTTAWEAPWRTFESAILEARELMLEPDADRAQLKEVIKWLEIRRAMCCETAVAEIL